MITGGKNYPGRRYSIFLIGLFICSFGVACTTKAGLGTSPVAAIPYTLSLIFTELSFGNWLILFCMFQILAQLVMLGKRNVASEIVIQAILAFVYGYLTDFSLLLLKVTANAADQRLPHCGLVVIIGFRRPQSYQRFYGCQHEVFIKKLTLRQTSNPMNKFLA